MDKSKSIEITFLGTGTSQGVPLIACQCGVCKSSDNKDKRLRSSILIQTPDASFAIDTGPDFRQQMLRAEVTTLDAVVFTHGHKDHTAGFDDIRAFNYIQQRDMLVFADKWTDWVLRKDFDYVFEKNPYPGVPKAEIHIIDNKAFMINETKVIPIDVMHHKLPVKGFRIGNFCYITDANAISDTEKAKLKGSDVLVLNALRREPHISHFTLAEAIALAQEIGAKKTYFTHISHQMGRHKDVSEQLPANIHLAFDGLKLKV